MQILPGFAMLLGGVASAVRRTRVVLVAAASYALLVGILLQQALSGQSILAPAGLTPVALLAATLLALAYAVLSRRAAT